MPCDRFLEIARDPARLCLRNGCLMVQREGLPDLSMTTFELSAVVLAHPKCTITQPAMNALMVAGVPLLVCDDTFLPSGMMLPLRANALQTQRFLAQASAKAPLKKRLWQHVVRTKLRAQGAALVGLHQNDGGLHAMAERVRSGDPMNVEATAAQRYWPLLFRDPEFRRHVEAPDQNRLLNYGYAILRAAVARAICAAGLHPSIGLHHKGRENSFCLADDLMEPYRPLVDAEVAAMTGERGRDCALDTSSKARLIGLLDLRLQTRRGEPDMRSVSECIGRTAFSLAEAFGGVRPDAGTTGGGPGGRGHPLFFPLGLVEW
ncbi:MAG: type II CRISPR-associated endonuclease Cas1 [Phycisphaerales bacterium]|nr:type II CRISPR-associated endonuclease Cas1 [Phycisphaerales bacterium]